MSPHLFEMVTPSGWDSVKSTKALATGAWQYVTITEASSEGSYKLTLYLNGAVAAETTGVSIPPASLGSSVSDDYLGKSLSGAPPFSGGLSNLAFYRKALTAKQVEEHYDDAEYPVEISPPTVTGTPREGSVLTAEHGSWSGAPTIAYSYQWERCASPGVCSAISKATKATYTPVSEDVDKTLRVAVQATNGAGSGSASSEQTVTVEGKPANTAAPIISGEAKVGQLLSVSEGSWRAFPAPATLGYLWENCVKKECKGAEGEDKEARYRITGPELGDTLRAAVTATNALGAGSATSAATANVVAGPPVNVERPTVSGLAREGQELTGGLGVWAGSAPIEYAYYRWLRCAAGECHSIEGESGTKDIKYTLTASDVGYTVEAQITAKNSVGETTVASVATAPVTSAKPEATAPPTLSGEAKDEHTLTASTGTWTGTPTITYTYQWESCNTAGEGCSSIEGAVASSYAIAHEEVGHTIRVRVLARNEAGAASATSTQTATVVPSPPVSTAPPVVSGEPKDEKTLTASTGTWTGSPTITYTYQWEACNTAGESCANISGATTATFAIGHDDVGSTLRVVVTATNSAGSTSKGSQASVVVVPSPPANIALPAVTGTAKEGQTLSATPGEWAGSEPVVYTDFVWLRCKAGSCQPISGASGATDTSYVLAAADVGSTIEVTVTAKNSAGEASATSQPTAEVTTGAPQNIAPPAIVGKAQSGQTLTATTGTWAGTTPLTYSYLWEECNSHGQGCQGIASAMSNGYTLSSTNIGHAIRVTVTAENVAGSAASSSETTATVLEAGCTDGWTGPTEGAWETPGNWSTGKAPGPADTACIPAGGTVDLRGGTNETGVLRGEGELVVSGGTLKLANSAKASELTSLTQSGGTIAGATLEISRALGWTGGTMEGSGPIILGPDAVSSLNNVTLGCELINEGTLTLAQHVWSGYPHQGSLTNRGTLQKPEGSAAAVIAMGFANEGTVNIGAGALELESGGLPTLHPGVWSAASGAAILFRGGEYNLGSSATFSGAITITDGVRMAVQQINGANAELSVAANGNDSYRPTVLDIEGPGTSTIGTLNVNGAIGWETIASAALTGSGHVDVTKAFTGGTFAYLEGAGSTVIEPTATASVSSSLGIQEEHKLENAGTLTISEGASINGGSAGGLINTGTLQKPEGTGTATIDAPIDNEGTVSVTAGSLELRGGGSSGEHHSDSWTAAEGARVVFSDQEFALGSSVDLAGDVEVSQGTVTAGTVEGSSAAVTLNGSQWERRGTLEVNGETPSTLGTLTPNGGGIAGPGKLLVANAFLSEAGALLSGTGVLELQAGATGTVADVTLEERTLENAGALIIGATGTIDASKGARLVNDGTLTMNAEGLGSNRGILAAGYTATLVNIGVIQRTEGAGPGLISFAIDNDGTINADVGTLEFTGGGASAEFASDTWTAAPGAAIELNGISSGRPSSNTFARIHRDDWGKPCISIATSRPARSMAAARPSRRCTASLRSPASRRAN